MVWKEAARMVERLKADVIHAFWGHPCGVIAAWHVPRTPIVISLAGGELIDLPSIDYGLIGRWHLRVMLRWALRRANVITAGSKYLLNIVQRFVPEGHFEFAPLGVDVTLFNGSPANRSHRIINVGSLEPVKGHAILLRAFRRVRDQRPNAELIIVGQGRLENPLRRLARDLDLLDHIEFRGEVAHHHLPDLYRSAALFVQSSWHEAQGVALLEAAACGLPIVGTNVGALVDLAPEAAVAVPVGDVEALAGTLMDVLDDADPHCATQWGKCRAAQLGQAARQAVEREYSIQCASDRFMTLYRASLISA
jgi:glycosyltransferase involved in cell wall biosynthesis